MAEKRVAMDRRKFLYKSATFFAGSLFGLNFFSKALGANNPINQPRIALIIDDIGFSRSLLRKFLEIQVPMTFAILPRLEKSHDLAKEIHVQGHEIMLHQPMEPFDPHIDPGPGAVYVGDDANKIVRTIGENISDTPFVTGINNHMGSRFTSRQKEMKEALKAIKKRGLFFVDSLTTSRSTAFKTARRLHMATACRNLFLDNYPEESAILSQLCKLKELAIRSGHAIGIGHPYPETAKAIDSFQKGLKGPGVSMVHISRLIPA
ncbi:divergent polysaccharide deacetylase family protein [Thermodesulfobacteriota bacterium]